MIRRLTSSLALKLEFKRVLVKYQSECLADY